MAGLGSAGYDILKLAKIIENYVKYESAFARAELSNMILNGEDFIDALDNIGLNMEEDVEEYNKLEEKGGDLVKNLESLIKGKEGPFVEKIKGFIKEYNQE